tara:strand:- start:967 stop:1275 length:309 start_codon:yes stop_codon:yes gene_type:complete
MKHLLLTTIAAVVLVGCATTQQTAPAPDAKPVEPVAEAATPEPPDAPLHHLIISIHDAAIAGDIRTIKQHFDAGTDMNAREKYVKIPFVCGILYQENSSPSV